jgi:alpha,alpha-trehalose phosphorylase
LLNCECRTPSLLPGMFGCSDAFTPEQWARNFEYYERITVRDSSLSAGAEAVAAADAGHLRLALDYAAEAALLDRGPVGAAPSALDQ